AEATLEPCAAVVPEWLQPGIGRRLDGHAIRLIGNVRGKCEQLVTLIFERCSRLSHATLVDAAHEIDRPLALFVESGIARGDAAHAPGSVPMTARARFARAAFCFAPQTFAVQHP